MSLFFFDFFLREKEKRPLINAYGRAEGKSEAFWYKDCLCEEICAKQTKTARAEQEIILIKKKKGKKIPEAQIIAIAQCRFGHHCAPQMRNGP